MDAIHIDPQAIARVLAENLRRHSISLGMDEVGFVLEAGDGIARVSGLPGVMAEEMLLFPGNVYGMAMNLEKAEVGAIIFGDYARVQQGSEVKRTGKVLQVPVGEALLGRVVNTLGQPIDGRGPIAATAHRLVDADAPGIEAREQVHEPLQTGLKSIDALTPIGRGQRELVVGDRQTGKTTLVVDTILNQKAGDVRCVYVAIGQKMASVVRLAALLEERGALANCTIVAATANESAPLQYMAPFAGCTMAEYFRDKGGAALAIYDDLSKHAVAYRQMSLLLRRPAGREAYPGDIFYLHSRLLERAAKLHPSHGGGSLTAMPVIETQQGDYSAYIPTNLISITDGQIYLETDLFHQGFKPAINAGLSVSRVGTKAQTKAMRKVTRNLRMDFAQYRELAAFAQLSTELDETTMAELRRGERLAEALKQDANAPLRMEQEVCMLWAASRGFLSDIPVPDVRRFEEGWLAFLEHTNAELLHGMATTGDLSEEAERRLEAAARTFVDMFVSKEKV